MSLWTPHGVTTKMAQEREALAASLFALSEAGGLLDYWNKRVREIDPYVQVVKGREQAAPIAGLKPGYYHLLRVPPDGPPTLVVHETPDGEFMDLGESIIDRLKRNDLWDVRVQREKERQLKEQDAQRASQAASDADERREELKDRYKHKYVTKIAVPR